MMQTACAFNQSLPYYSYVQSHMISKLYTAKDHLTLVQIHSCAYTSMIQTACVFNQGLPYYSYPKLQTALLKNSTLSVVLTAPEHFNELPSAIVCFSKILPVVETACCY